MSIDKKKQLCIVQALRDTASIASSDPGNLSPASQREESEVDVTVTLTATDQKRLADIRRLRAADGKAWPSDKAMVESIVSRGIMDELRDEQAYAEARENPMRINERGSLDFLMRQAM